MFFIVVNSDSDLNYEYTACTNGHNGTDPQLFLIYANDLQSSCDDIVPFLYADDVNYVFIRPKNATSTLQDKVEHIPSSMAKNN